MQGEEACPLWPGSELLASPRVPHNTLRTPPLPSSRWPRPETQAARPLHALPLLSSSPPCSPARSEVTDGARSPSRTRDQELPGSVPDGRGSRAVRAALEPRSAGAGQAVGWWVTWQRGWLVHRVLWFWRSELRAWSAGAAVQGTKGPFLLLPAPGLLPTSLGCPCPTPAGEASNATNCEDPAHGAPPTLAGPPRGNARPLPVGFLLALALLTCP